MRQVREAIGTIVTLLKLGPPGKGSPIPQRPKFDEHTLAAAGVDDEAQQWLKDHAPKFRQPPRKEVA